jgi:hypothetical protein
LGLIGFLENFSNFFFLMNNGYKCKHPIFQHYNRTGDLAVMCSFLLINAWGSNLPLTCFIGLRSNSLSLLLEGVFT